MSGHSKWHNIKEKKGSADVKRGQLFTKLANSITITARESGGDPNANPKLAFVIEQAKKANMPKDNIERAIKRGAGEIGGEKIEEVRYEALGPNGSVFLIITATDNRNRTVSEIKNILSRHGGSLGGPNSAAWRFKQKGIIRIAKENFDDKNGEAIQLIAINAGAEDIEEQAGGIIITCAPDQLAKVQKILVENGIAATEASLGYIAANPLELDEAAYKKTQTLEEALEDHKDVIEIYSNIK